MDCLMPVMDGYDATGQIRRSEPEVTRTPAIAIAANVTDREGRRCLAVGMDDYISKPVTPRCPAPNPGPLAARDLGLISTGWSNFIDDQACDLRSLERLDDPVGDTGGMPLNTILVS